MTRRRNAVTCLTAGCDRKTHHGSHVCATCREVPLVHRHDDGLIVMGQIRLTEAQAVRLADLIIDAIEEADE